MSAQRFVLIFLSCLLLAGQLSFPSAQVDAAENKPAKKPAQPKKEMPKPESGIRDCCDPGLICPAPQTEGSPGCKCCGFLVVGRLEEISTDIGKDSLLTLTKTDGTVIPVTFVVTDKGVHSKLKAIGNGTDNVSFILKQKLFDNSMSPTGKGARLECIDTGNSNNIKDRTKDFLKGVDVSSKVYQVIEALFNTTPTHDPELPEDKQAP